LLASVSSLDKEPASPAHEAPESSLECCQILEVTGVDSAGFLSSGALDDGAVQTLPTVVVLLLLSAVWDLAMRNEAAALR
jgi:hypothetical protein